MLSDELCKPLHQNAAVILMELCGFQESHARSPKLNINWKDLPNPQVGIGLWTAQTAQELWPLPDISEKEGDLPLTFVEHLSMSFEVNQSSTPNSATH